MIKYGFFNSLNHDRVYDAEDMSAIFNNIITDGVFDNYGKFFATRASGNGLDIIVGTGRAWFDSTWTMSDSDITLTVPAADVSLTRIDSVILEVDHSVGVRANSIKILKGTPSSTPVAPTLTHGPDVYQHALANITLAPGTATITDSMIENLVGRSGCPFVTSVLESVAIDDLFAKWENDFTTWFDDLQAKLSGDIATNLQNQINALNEKVDDNWEKTLSDATKTILSIPKSSTPDDAFCKLALGIGKYGYAIHVQLEDGTPVPNAKISSALLAPDGSALVTDENGDAVGASESTSIRVSITSPFFDIDDNTVTINSTGILTKMNVTLPKRVAAYDTYFMLRSSQEYFFSPFVKSFDLTAVGGGGSGVYAHVNHGASGQAGGGGGGGYVATRLGISTLNIKSLVVEIGSPAHAPHWDQDDKQYTAGATVVSANGITLLSANGGNSGRKSNGGTGNGNGANGYGSVSGGNGSGYIFNNSSLGIAGGGGGGGGGNSGNNINGGSPFGGNGGVNSGTEANHIGKQGRGPGGGGGGAVSATGVHSYPCQGSSGIVYIKVYS